MKMLDSIGYSMTLNEIANYVVENGAKCTCGYVFRKSDIRNYSHASGLGVLGHQQKQWIYFLCKNCKYKSKIIDIKRRIELEKGSD